MTRTALCVILIAGLSNQARAQVEEIGPAGPSAAPPPAAPAPPPTIRVRYSRYRTSWSIGFGLGAGAGWIRSASAREGGAGLAFTVFKVGWVARPWLLLGFEGSTWFRLEGELLDNRWTQFLHYDLVTSVFPGHDGGLYAKGGVGVGVAIVERSVLGQTVERKDTGVDLKLGLGYEWQLLTAFNLGADLTYSLTVFDGGQAHDLSAQLTFVWY